MFIYRVLTFTRWGSIVVFMQAKVFVEPGKPTIIYCEKYYIERFTKGNCPSCFKPVMSKTDPYITHNKKSWHTVGTRRYSKQ